MEFLADMVTIVPDGVTEAEVEETKSREAVRAAELARQGHLLRLWKPPVASGEWRTFGLWSAEGEDEMRAILASLPLHVWMTIELTPLAPHPNDPGSRSA